jgi:hypothetical protein
MTDVDISKFEMHNILRRNGGLQSREALFSHTDVTNAVWGCSIESANTSEVWHYILTRSSTTSDGTITVYTEEFVSVCSINIGKIIESPDVTFATSDNQIMINSPHFAWPVYGIVGGGLRRSVKVASINETTSVIDVPNGLVIEFGGRFVIAQGNILWFSDPGVTAKETFVAANSLPLGAKILDLMIGDLGALVVGTANGVRSIPADSVAQGQFQLSLVQEISPYQCRNHRNLVYSQGRLIGLGENGIVDVVPNATPIPLITYNNARYYSKDVREVDDFREGKIFPSQDYGAIVALNKSFCCVSIINGLMPTWVTSSSNIALKSMLRTGEGKDLFLTDQNVLEFFGTAEFDSGSFNAVACGDVPLSAGISTLLRYVHTSADNVGSNQLCATGGAPRSKETPPPTRALNIIGTSAWSATNKYCEDELRARRADYSYRTNQMQIEVGVDRPNVRIGNISYDTKLVGSLRP